MITEKELLNAIKECESEPITLSKVNKLASFYIIYDHLFGRQLLPEPLVKIDIENIIEIDGDSEFFKAINGRKAKKVWDIIDKLMQAIYTLHPQMYDRVIDEIYDI